MNNADIKEPPFKVVDRRRFTEDGDLRSDSNNQEEAQAEKIDDMASPEDIKNPTKHLPISFSMFIESLAHQSMMALGILPWPDSGLIKVDLVVAKETIDVLHMLKEKTLGNTSKDEEALLNSLLYQLQMAFVEVSGNNPIAGGETVT